MDCFGQLIAAFSDEFCFFKTPKQAFLGKGSLVHWASKSQFCASVQSD
jgi:hypothetical protein